MLYKKGMDTEKNKAYRVLARKYRPQNFDELIGQDVLVRTLKNAITSGRVAHAFMLTGVRGVGKTTTARIIAKALNYKGPDGTHGPTTENTSDCTLCRAISEDRHPDVIEMDAASRTGVDDIREILDGVRYAPSEARYKIYVIDEVHMLSRNAFNALLKTLEEPPEHVKFIFATTEIRKVPVTVLSRCQRFDLQRVGVDVLEPHFQSICDKENVKAQDEAIAMIARAADGSVRDGLSLLDQAIALSGDEITAELVRDMLGLSDRAQNIDLFEKSLEGDAAGALAVMDVLYKSGAAPSVVIQDLLDLTHMLMKQRAVPDLDHTTQALSVDQHVRIKEMAQKISMPSLGKAWQILLKGLEEINGAHNPQNAAEIVIIRLSYAANLPDPADVVKTLSGGDTPPPVLPGGGGSAAGPRGEMARSPEFAPVPSGGGGGEVVACAMPGVSAAHAPDTVPVLRTLEDVITLLRMHEEFLLAEQVFHFAHLVGLHDQDSGARPAGRLEFRPGEGAAPEMSQNLSKTLKRITGRPWAIVLSSDREGAETLAVQAESKRLQELEDVAQIPLVKNVLEMFPGACLTKVSDRTEGDVSS